MLYVEELIGPNTINTVPPATLDAFRDHGTPRDSLEENLDDARRVLEELEKSGISLDAITAELVKDGVKLFADAADKLYGAVAYKRATVLGAAIDRQQLSLGAQLAKAVEKTSEDWRASARIRRLWHKDKSVWSGDDEDKWLGWLNSPAAADIADYEDFAGRVKGQNFSDAVVLGMGGSSLGPEVLAETFEKKPGFPKLHVLDSTDPAQVRAMEAKVDLAKTAVHRLQQIRRHHRAQRDEGLFLRSRRRKPSAPPRPGTALSRSPIPARRWRRSRPSKVLRASSTAIPPSADVTPCCRRSGWFRRRPPASMFAP